MQTLINFWNFLNGRKTDIGAAFLLAALFFSQVVIGIWHVTAPWTDYTAQTLTWIGGIITTGGFLHKGVTAVQ